MVRIITDSSTLYTEKEARNAGFESVPLCVSIGDWHGRDLKMDMEAFYRKIEEGQIPTSSQPPIGDVLDVYEAHCGEEIINISMADGLSGTYQSACSAREMAGNREDITVFNSQTLCGPHRYMAEQAQRMAKAGSSRQEILAWLSEAAGRTESFLIPQDFSFLKRGGRLTPVAAAIGGLLKLKPVVKLTDDGMKLDKFGIKRTMSSAVESIVKYLKGKKLGPGHMMYISHAGAPEDALAVRTLLEAEFPGMEVQILKLSPVFVAQGGPRCVAVQYIEKKQNRGAAS